MTQFWHHSAAFTLYCIIETLEIMQGVTEVAAFKCLVSLEVKEIGDMWDLSFCFSWI